MIKSIVSTGINGLNCDVVLTAHWKVVKKEGEIQYTDKENDIALHRSEVSNIVLYVRNQDDDTAQCVVLSRRAFMDIQEKFFELEGAEIETNLDY